MKRVHIFLLCSLLSLGILLTLAPQPKNSSTATSKALGDPKAGDSTVYLDQSPLATPEYKKALAKFYWDALKKSPGYGYDADAVIWGNSWPESGSHTSSEKPPMDDAQRIRALNEPLVLSKASDGTIFKMERLK